ncbi:uncharacterized protein LOC143675970 isoform X2 [Tamandua tetradactyla]|uniref:uncharacterized protein LOC143675970 isoform X2 n=1 Tax=Tamandua tetradactyla TaxID=48850 RepID=UPI0040540316
MTDCSWWLKMQPNLILTDRKLLGKTTTGLAKMIGWKPAPAGVVILPLHGKGCLNDANTEGSRANHCNLKCYNPTVNQAVLPTAPSECQVPSQVRGVIASSHKIPHLM